MGSGAREDYPAIAKPGGAREEGQDRLSPAPPPPPALDREAGGEGRSAKWSPGRRDIVRGPELRKLLKEQLEEPNQSGIRSAWQEVELVRRVLRALVARLELGGMGLLVARALDPRCMALAGKEVSEYAGVAVPFYERWAHRHEFLLRGQRRGETVEEYFRAKWELLVDSDTYGDIMAAYPAYWSGLRSQELVILMDARVLGRIWSGQIMGRDPQIETWRPCRSCCPTWRTSGPCSRRCGLSRGMGAEVGKRRGVLAVAPRRRPRPGKRVAGRPLSTQAKGRAWPELGRPPTHRWRHHTWREWWGVARARGGELAWRTRLGPPRQRCRHEPPRKSSRLEGARTYWEDPSRAEEGSSLQQGRGGLLPRYWRHQPQGKEKRRRDRLWWKGRRTTREPTVPKEQRRERGAVETHRGPIGRSGEAT